MNRHTRIARLLGAVVVVVWLPLLLAGIKSLQTRGPLGDSDDLIVSGAYAHVRHPLYAGLSMSVVGLGLIIGSRRLVLGGLAWLAVTRLWSLHEETDLAEKFGPAYERYRRATPAMVPDLSRLWRVRR